MVNLYFPVKLFSPVSLYPHPRQVLVVLHEQFRRLLCAVQHEVEMVAQKAKSHDLHGHALLNAIEVAHSDSVHAGDKLAIIGKDQVGFEPSATVMKKGFHAAR